MKKTTPLALATLSAVALVGGAALTGSTAQADDGTSRAFPAKPAKKAVVQTCTGGAGISMFNRSMDNQSIPGGTTAEVEGSQWSVKGPKKGSDTVLVTLTAFANSGGAGEMSYVELFRDGAGTSEGAKYFTYNGEWDQASVTFCTKLKKGNHTFDLRVQDDFGNATTLYYPTVTYQRFR